MLSSLTINEYAARLASEEAPPGGGSTTALSGLLAAGLLEMAINYSLKNPQLIEHQEILIAKQADLSRMHIELTILIDRDALALRGLLAAVGMPDGTNDARKARDIALQKSLRQAAEVPLETARACLEVLEIGKAILGSVDPLVVSDLMAGILTAHAAVTGSLLSTAINLGELQDEGLVSALKGQIYLIKTASDELKTFMETKILGCEPFTVLKG